MIKKYLSLTLSAALLSGCLGNEDGESVTQYSATPTIVDEPLETAPKSFWSFYNKGYDKTFLKCYGLPDEKVSGFIDRKDLIKAAWGKNAEGDYIELGGSWLDSGLLATRGNYFTVDYLDGKELSEEALTQQMTSACQRGLDSKYPGQGYDAVVRYFAADSNLGNDFPLLLSSQAEAVSSTMDEVVNYSAILRYAYAANYVYSIEEGVPAFSFNDDPEAQYLMMENNQIQELGRLIPFDNCAESDSDCTDVNYAHAVAIKVPAIPERGLNEEVIISYKGTVNQDDMTVDLQLMLANFRDDKHLENWLKNTYNFYHDITTQLDKPVCKDAYDVPFQNDTMATDNCYSVVITGHSLGAFLASDVGTRTGVATRVFSSPATYMSENIRTIFASQMHLNNVVNFYRKGDPVVVQSGRHVENKIEYQAPTADGWLAKWLDRVNPVEVDSHFLQPAIVDIYRPLAQYQSTQLPTLVKTTPDLMLGSGMERRLNIWGQPE